MYNVRVVEEFENFQKLYFVNLGHFKPHQSRLDIKGLPNRIDSTYKLVIDEEILESYLKVSCS